MLREIRNRDRQGLFHILSFLVGSIAVFSYLSVMFGGIDRLAQVLVILAVCTFGIGFVIVLAIFSVVAWLVGMIIVAPIWFLVLPYLDRNSARRETNLDTPPQQTPSLTGQQMAMVKYVRQAIACGFSDEKITNRLKSQGWNDEEINRAYEIVSNNSSPT